MIDDRPIKPDKKYLEEYIEKISHVQTKTFLKRKSQPLLPCQQHQLQKALTVNKEHKKNKTKAEIYEEIKIKNKLKFGQKKIEEPQIPENKKIDPKKITVSYKPKKQTIIQIQQYKKTGAKTQKHTVQTSNEKTKAQYEKLLEYYKQQLNHFEKQKEEFNKVAGKLKFKEMIKNQQGLTVAKIKQSVENHLITQNFSQNPITTQNLSENSNHVNIKANTDYHKSPNIQKQAEFKRADCSKEKHKQNIQKNMSKTFSVGEIKNQLNETTVRMKELKNKVLQRNTNVNEHCYDISQIYLLPAFTPQALYEYIDPNALKYDSNELYLKAIAAFHSKFNKEALQNKAQKINQMDVIHEYQQQHFEKEIKVKFVGEKRVMKYDGWTQVWIPGRQRLMSNGAGYKVIWLHNGDVMQQFPHEISSYYSCSKKINKILYKKMNPIYYSKETGQLWWFTQNHMREIVFDNGRQETVQQSA